MNLQYHPIRILLVEDDEDDYTLIRDLLSDFCISGSKLHWVSDYDAALQVIHGEEFDVCLLDYRLGSRDGLEFLKEVTQSGCRTPIIFLTGHGNYKLDLEAMRSGAADFLSKDQLSATLLERSIRYTIEVKQKNEELLRVKILAERKQAEQALHESEERLRLAMEATNDGVWDWNIKTGEVLRSPAFFSMLGYPPEEFKGLFEEWENLVHPDDRAAASIALQEYLTGKRKIYQIEYRMLNESGSASWILSRGKVVAFDEDGNPLRMVGTHTDITERKKAEEALSSKEATLRGILDAATESIWLFSADGFVLAANETALLRYSVSAEEVIGKHFSEILRTEPAQSRLAQLKNAVDSRRAIEFEDQRAGIMFHHTLYPILDSGGRVTGVVCFSRDVTERRRAEEDRRRLEQRLQSAQKAESLSRMAGAIAHNFNNMLGAIIGNLELALDDLPPGSITHSGVSEAIKASNRAAEVSRFMLTYLGHTQGKRELLNLTDVVGDAVSLLGASLPENVQITKELAPGKFIVRADGGHLRQILSNLVSNAVEAIGEKHGHIILSVQKVMAAEIKESKFFPLEWEPRATAYACISVSDTGPGMHKEVIEQIFDPFYSTKFTGRGLGLSVVLGLVRAHDGAISVESQNGIGTTFKVYLPGELYVELPSPRIDESSSQLEGNEELVLLVDDESLIRNMAESLLRKRFGYSVVCASDGAEAVEIFRARGAEFSFVILDLSMPGMNGWETLNALRSLRPDIPVILTSGYDEAQLSRGEHQEKPQAFLAKPYGSEDLKRSIEACRRQTGQG